MDVVLMHIDGGGWVRVGPGCPGATVALDRADLAPVAHSGADNDPFILNRVRAAASGIWGRSMDPGLRARFPQTEPWSSCRCDGPWTRAEIARLERAQRLYGPDAWACIAADVGTRSVKDVYDYLHGP